MKIDPTKKIVVFNALGDLAVENKLFDRKLVGLERHGWAGCYLYEECLKAGIQLVTPDIFFSLTPRPTKGIFINNAAHTQNVKELIKAGLYPAALFAFEHPLYSCEFFYHLKKYTRVYDHTFMPSGAKSIVSSKTKFHTWVSPQPYSKDIKVSANFNKKKFLTAISSNARLNPKKRLYVHIMNFLKPLPTLANRELYLDRLEAIKYFSKNADFDLFGHNWDKPVLYTNGKYEAAIKKSYRGIVGDKFEVLKNYKFAIIFENAIYNGWITEKIIDALYAGCVPIYWGAPEITDFIPEGAFIDFKKFFKNESVPSEKSYTNLETFLRDMDEKTYQGYIDKINEFIQSDKANIFSQEKYAEDTIKLIQSYP